MAVLGLRCCVQAFSSCGKRGLLFDAVRGLLIAVVSLLLEHRLQAHGLWQLWLAGCRAQAQQLWRMALAAPRHVGSSQTRDRTSVPCIGRWILLFLFYRDFIYLFFIFGCIGSVLLCMGFLQLRRAGATLHCTAWTSRCSGFSCCGARALGTRASVVVARELQQLWLTGSRAQAQQLWCTGLVAPWHVGSSQTRAQTHVLCIGRRILNHCTTREVPIQVVLNFFQRCEIGRAHV